MLRVTSASTRAARARSLNVRLRPRGEAQEVEPCGVFFIERVLGQGRARQDHGRNLRGRDLASRLPQRTEGRACGAWRTKKSLGAFRRRDRRRPSLCSRASGESRAPLYRVVVVPSPDRGQSLGGDPLERARTDVREVPQRRESTRRQVPLHGLRLERDEPSLVVRGRASLGGATGACLEGRLVRPVCAPGKAAAPFGSARGGPRARRRVPRHVLQEHRRARALALRGGSRVDGQGPERAPRGLVVSPVPDEPSRRPGAALRRIARRRGGKCLSKRLTRASPLQLELPRRPRMVPPSPAM